MARRSGTVARTASFAVAAAFFAAFLLRYLRRLVEFNRIPCEAPGALEMLTLFVRHRGDLGKIVVALNDSHGYAPLKFMAGFGLVRVILVSSPAMRTLGKLPKGSWYYMLNVLFGDNLITLNHERHRRHRRALSHGFSFNKLYAVLPSLNRHADALVGAWRGQKTVEVEEWMTKVTFDIISDQAFGFDARCLENNPTGESFARNCRGIAGMVMKHYLHAPAAARVWKALHYRLFRDVDKIIYECIAKRREERSRSRSAEGVTSTMGAVGGGSGGGNGGSGGFGGTDLLDLMLDAAECGKDEGNRWTDEELRDECFILFLAGHETTAETLSWVLTHLAADPELQARVREEVCGVAVVCKETLDNFPELTKVCKEALRVYPPAFMVTRYGEHAVEVDGVPIPKGYDFMLNLIGMQRDPNAFGDTAKQFRPERWDSPSLSVPGRLDHASGHFAPFTFGPRQCLGKNFFWLEAKSILSAVLKNYELSLPGGAASIPDWSTIKISTQPSEPVWVTVTPLTEA